MKDWAFLLIGVGVLLALEKKENLSSPKKRQKESITEILLQDLEIFFIASFFFIVCFLIRHLSLLASYHEELSSALVWVGIYTFTHLRKRSMGFFVATLCLTLWALHTRQGPFFGALFGMMFFWVVGVGFFQACLSSLLRRLVFSPLPRSLQGLPALLLLVFLLSLGFSGLFPLLP